LDHPPRIIWKSLRDALASTTRCKAPHSTRVSDRVNAREFVSPVVTRNVATMLIRNSCQEYGRRQMPIANPTRDDAARRLVSSSGLRRPRAQLASGFLGFSGDARRCEAIIVATRLEIPRRESISSRVAVPIVARSGGEQRPKPRLKRPLYLSFYLRETMYTLAGNSSARIGRTPILAA